jgi:hypothetical protein
MTLFTSQSYYLLTFLASTSLPQKLSRDTAASEKDGASSATADNPVAVHTTVLSAHGQKNEQRAFRKREPSQEVTHEDGYRQRHFASGEFAATSADPGGSRQVSLNYRDLYALLSHEEHWLTAVA